MFHKKITVAALQPVPDGLVREARRVESSNLPPVDRPSGRCIQCARAIEAARLQILPGTTYCLSCARRRARAAQPNLFRRVTAYIRTKLPPGNSGRAERSHLRGDVAEPR